MFARGLSTVSAVAMFAVALLAVSCNLVLFPLFSPVSAQHMSAEIQKAKEHFSTGLLDQIHNWTHANV